MRFRLEESSTIELDCGETLYLELIGNPSTGYIWEGVSVGALLALKGGPKTTLINPEAIGGSCLEEYEYVALEPGWTMIRFKRYRPWEKDGAVALRTLKVIIRPRVE
jgi:predicted secreted protein